MPTPADGAGGPPDGEGRRAEGEGGRVPSWPIRYAVDGASVVAIGTYPRYASLFFFRGRELDDGSGLLDGAGKDLRHIKLREPRSRPLASPRPTFVRAMARS